MILVEKVENSDDEISKCCRIISIEYLVEQSYWLDSVPHFRCYSHVISPNWQKNHHKLHNLQNNFHHYILLSIQPVFPQVQPVMVSCSCQNLLLKDLHVIRAQWYDVTYYLRNLVCHMIWIFLNSKKWRLSVSGARFLYDFNRFGPKFSEQT